MIGRAAYSDGVPLWSETHQDDLNTYYETHHLVVAEETAVEPEPSPSASQTNPKPHRESMMGKGYAARPNTKNFSHKPIKMA